MSSTSTRELPSAAAAAVVAAAATKINPPKIKQKCQRNRCAQVLAMNPRQWLHPPLNIIVVAVVTWCAYVLLSTTYVIGTRHHVQGTYPVRAGSGCLVTPCCRCYVRIYCAYACTSRDVISGFWGGIGVGCVGCLLVEVVVVAMTAAVTARVTRKAFVINIGTTAYTLFSR